MVRIFKYQNRHAFTMIELIFAIVIIAISVMSLPMITQVTSSAIEKNLAQEAVFSAVAEINIATTYTWDENSLLDFDSNASIDELSRVINNNGTQCSDSGIDDSNGDDIMRRSGHVHRKCLNELSSLLYAGTDYVDSLEASAHDYNLTVEGTASTTSASGYKKEYESRLEVERCGTGNCIEFGSAGADMKEIKVTIRDKSTTETVTILRAYGANIGEVSYHKRTL